MEISSGPDTLGEVEAALSDFWSQHDDVPAQVQMEVTIAAAEIAANILEHGHAVGFRMELQVLPHEVHVEFIDRGEPVQIELDRVCMPDGMAEHGRGLAMAQAALRVLSYFRDELGNHWRLVSRAFPGNPGQA